MSLESEEQGGFDTRSKVLLALTMLGLILLAAGAYKASRNLELRAHGEYALWDSIRDEKPERLRKLLELGADPNSTGDDYTILLFAVRMASSSKQTQHIETLLEFGADPSLTSELGQSPRDLNLYLALT